MCESEPRYLRGYKIAESHHENRVLLVVEEEQFPVVYITLVLRHDLLEIAIWNARAHPLHRRRARLA